MRKVLIAPSLLAADPARLGEEVRSAEAAGADIIHVDVCDGCFVPNISVGPATVEALKPWTKLPFDVHLMIADPAKYIEAFASAGSDYLTVHFEACEDPRKVVGQIKSFGVKAGLSINPKTPASAIEDMLDELDMVLVMSVVPGFAGQEFLKDVLPKISRLREIWPGDIEVDGGVDNRTGKLALDAGANILVAGSYIFKAPDRSAAIRSLRG